MKTIVSLTPISIERDSRTFKQASSVARLGYRSIVVELERSENINEEDLLFELISVDTKSSFKKKYSKERVLEIARKLGLAGIPILLLFYARKLFFKPLKKIPNASLYYLHGFTLFPLVWIKCYILKAKFIYDAHDFYSDQLSESENNDLKKRFFKPLYVFLEKLCIDRSSKVITVSEGIASLLKNRFGCIPEVIHNFEDKRLYRNPAIGLRQRLMLNKNNIILLALGNAKKGIAINELIESISGLPSNVHLVFVGRYYEPYQKIPVSLNLSDRVHFLDAVGPYEIVKFIESADISLVLYIPNNPNNINSCPNKFFQSISAELPLLFSKLPEMQRYADEYSLGIGLETLDAKSLANEISNLIFDKQALGYYKSNLRSAKNLLNWESEERIYSELFSELL